LHVPRSPSDSFLASLERQAAWVLGWLSIVVLIAKDWS